MKKKKKKKKKKNNNNNNNNKKRRKKTAKATPMLLMAVDGDVDGVSSFRHCHYRHDGWRSATHSPHPSLLLLRVCSDGARDNYDYMAPSTTATITKVPAMTFKGAFEAEVDAFCC